MSQPAPPAPKPVPISRRWRVTEQDLQLIEPPASSDGKTVTPQRRAKLLALDALHQEFVASKLPVTEFDPASRPGSEDYNQHFVDLDGDDDEFHRRAMEIMRP